MTLPALAERTDLPVLVERILARLRNDEADSERMPVRVSADVLDCFERCRWPGNLRQLANVLRTASIMAEGTDQIELDDLPEDFLHDCDDATANENPPSTLKAVDDATGDAGSAHTPQPSRMDDWQAALIAQTLTRLDGNVSAAARELGLARNTVYRYLRRGGAAH